MLLKKSLLALYLRLKQENTPRLIEFEEEWVLYIFSSRLCFFCLVSIALVLSTSELLVTQNVQQSRGERELKFKISHSQQQWQPPSPSIGVHTNIHCYMSAVSLAPLVIAKVTVPYSNQFFLVRHHLLAHYGVYTIARTLRIIWSCYQDSFSFHLSW
jgi:hypothetical protein